MIRWNPTTSTTAPRRWQSRAEISKAYLTDEFETELLRLRIEHYALRLEWERIKREYYARKAGFRYDQPRWPKGNAEQSGRWSGGAGTPLAGAATILEFPRVAGIILSVGTFTRSCRCAQKHEKSSTRQ